MNCSDCRQKCGDGFEDIENSVNPGDVVKVDGVMDEFNGQQQIKINRIRKAAEQDNVTLDGFHAEVVARS